MPLPTWTRHPYCTYTVLKSLYSLKVLLNCMGLNSKIFYSYRAYSFCLQLSHCWALGSGLRYMICVTLFLHVARVRKRTDMRESHAFRVRFSFSHVRVFSDSFRVQFSHVRVFSDSRNMQKRATKSHTSGHCLPVSTLEGRKIRKDAYLS